MAAKKKKLENIKRKQVDYLDSVKVLTKWITNNKRTDEQLETLIEKYNIENSSIKRILSYTYSFPYIVNYFNRYLNNKYEFDSLDTKILIKSIVYLMHINNRIASKYFMFIRSNDLKDDVKEVIKKLIKEYLSITYSIECTNKELNFYYKLFKLGKIKDEDLLEIDRLLNGDKTIIKSLDFVNYKEALGFIENNNIEEEIEKKDIVKSDNIINFINSIKEDKLVNDNCKKCELYNKPIVVLDTNVSDINSDIDITFIGLNPGADEVKFDNPFVGDSGKYIRKIIEQLPKDKKWLIFNSILCHTNNKSDIKNVYDVIRNCQVQTNKIFGSFNSKLYILVGDDAKSLFGITDPISKCSGVLYSINESVSAIPLIHPSSILRNSKYQGVFDSSVKNILSQFNIIGDLPARSKSASESIVEDTSNLLLVDIKKIENNKILMIYTDLEGNKRYKIEEFNFPVLIKNKDWKECDMISKNVTDVCYLNDYQRGILNKKCSQTMQHIINI